MGLVHLAAQAADGRLGLQQGMGGKAAQRDDHLWLQAIDLPAQIVVAVGDFVSGRVAVTRWPALDDVTDIDVLLAVDTGGGQHVFQQLAGFADKRQPLFVLLLARGFADDQHTRLGAAAANYHLLAGRRQRAALAICHAALQCLPVPVGGQGRAVSATGGRRRLEQRWW